MKRLLIPVAAFALAAAAPVMYAQEGQLASDSTQVKATRVENGPRRESTVAGVRAEREPVEHALGSSAVAMQGRSTGRGQLYMVIGGAAFVGGLLIGDDAGTAIAVVGLGIGIYGLYLYMR
jgi:hypothetical protein